MDKVGTRKFITKAHARALKASHDVVDYRAAKAHYRAMMSRSNRNCDGNGDTLCRHIEGVEWCDECLDWEEWRKKYNDAAYLLQLAYKRLNTAVIALRRHDEFTRI